MDVDNMGPNLTEELGLWKSLRQGGASSCFRQLCGHLWQKEEVIHGLAEGWPSITQQLLAAEPGTSLQSSTSPSPEELCFGVIQPPLICARSTVMLVFHTHLQRELQRSVWVKMLFSAGCKAITLHLPPCGAGAPLIKGKASPFLNAAFHFAQSAFPHTPKLISAQVVFRL